MDFSMAIHGSIDAMMLWHVLLMNAAAPLVAYGFRARLPETIEESIFPAAAVQLALLWGWHSPIAMDAAMNSQVAGLVMQATLFLAALWFWSAVVKTSEHGRWRALIALALTGKLFCLLGALFVFSNSALYSNHGHALTADVAVNRQQFAGLLMLAVCPLTYIAAAIALAVRWFGRRPVAQL